MCGIAGFVLEKNNGDLSGLLQSMANSIGHRGPDDEGFFHAESSNGHFKIGIAHRRLSIIDLDTGHQPLGNEDDSVQIVFNGEIYNYQELRRNLMGLGHSFRTNSDTETIIHAYEEYGHDCVMHFRGMFAFAIWDSNKESLFLARDRFGKKPLYMYQSKGSLLFGSEVKSILQFDRVRPAVDIQAVWEYLSYRYVPAPRTLFDGVTKLSPGSYAVWDNGVLTENRYYSPPDCKPRHALDISGDVVDKFLEQLDHAVEIRMVSDVPFGAFLSGGIDSSAIVGLMSRHSDCPVKTFSVGFRESEYSELRYARTIAEQFKTEHHELTVSQNDLMDMLPALVRFRDAPVAEPSDIPIYLLSQEARKTVKMVLTGEGSDEFLGGYPKHVFERYVNSYQYIPGILRSGLIEPLIQALPYRFRRAKTAIHNMGLSDWQERMARWFGAMTAKERAALVAFNVPASYQRTHPASANINNSALRNILCFDQTSWLPDNLLERGDRMTMAASLEARMPFMDHELAAFVSALPDEMRVRGKTTKWILREAMTRLLPAEILERPKVGFRVPVNEWFQHEMKDYLYDHLTSESSCTRDLYDASTLHQILSDHVNGKQNHEKLLWGLLNLEIWYRQYMVAV